MRLRFEPPRHKPSCRSTTLAGAAVIGVLLAVGLYVIGVDDAE